MWCVKSLQISYRTRREWVSKSIYVVQLSKVSLRPGSNITTKTFWVHAWNCYMWCPRRACGPEDCSKHVAQWLRNSCHRTCCVCVERHTICRWKSVAAVDDLLRQDVCRRRGTEVPGQTKTQRQNMLVCSQRISVQEASATAAKPARYDRVVRLQWEAEQRRSGRTELSG